MYNIIQSGMQIHVNKNKKNKKQRLSGPITQ